MNIVILADMAIEKLNPAKKIPVQKKLSKPTPAPAFSTHKLEISQKINHSRYIPVKVKREVWKRDLSPSLRLRCAGHNQLAAIQVFGERKMAQFFGTY